jgi:hypothetical protein
MALPDQGLRDLGGEFLAPGENNPGQGIQAGWLLLHGFLQGIQPAVETLM